MAEEQLSEVAGILTGAPPPEGETPPTPEPVVEGEETPPSAEEPTEEGSSSDEPAPMTVKQLAAKLEMTPKQVYSALSLDMGGKSLTLGEIKDRAKELVKSDKTLADAESHQLAAENEILRKHQALALTIKAIGRQPSEAETNQAQALHDQYVREQQGLQLTSIPDWSDAEVQQADSKLIGKVLVEYGFSPVEIGQVVDHRQVKLLRDYSRMKARLDSVSAAEVRKSQQLKGGAKRKTAPAKRDPAAAHKKGQITQNVAVLQAIADGAKT